MFTIVTFNFRELETKEWADNSSPMKQRSSFSEEYQYPRVAAEPKGSKATKHAAIISCLATTMPFYCWVPVRDRGLH